MPGSTESIDFVPVPAGKITSNVDGIAHEIEVKELYMSRCEITWDLYDAFVFARDRGESDPADPVDAFARPSKPYITMDRGYGHTGYPAISISYKGAEEFCRWLSWRTGRTIRLPTEAEWEHACGASAPGTREVASKTSETGATNSLDDVAWYNANADDKTHPVGTKQANAFGVCDMLGNAREWCVDADGKPVTRGGSFKSDKAALEGGDRLLPSASWNRSDPQIPKSVWWLADGGFMGFRVVCESGPETAAR